MTTLDHGRMRSGGGGRGGGAGSAARGMGLVRDVFGERSVAGLNGDVGIGHVPLSDRRA